MVAHVTNILMEERCVLGNAQRWQLAEAVRCHMGGTYRGREWSRFTDAASSLRCGREVSSFLVREGGHVIVRPEVLRGFGQRLWKLNRTH